MRKFQLFNYLHLNIVHLLDILSSRGIPHLTVDLDEGDLLYIPQMWWQHVTFSAEYNLFVQFLWPSRTSKNSAKLRSSSLIRGDNLPSMPASFRSLLRKYEEKLLMMDVQPLDCSDQDKRMSEYTFETGKMSPEKYEIIHNGPDFTEVMTEICTCVITLTRHDVKIVQ